MPFGNNDIDRLFTLESGGDPNAVTGSNRGLGQFSPDLERKFGITDWRNPGQQRRAVQLEMNGFSQPLSQAFGRDPTPGEYYVAHQQGLAGALAHFDNPDEVAWKNIAKYYDSPHTARSAVWGNIPDNAHISPGFNKSMFPGGVDTVRSGDFVNGWVNKFENTDNYDVGAGSASPGTPGRRFRSVLKNPPSQEELDNYFGGNTDQATAGGMLSGTNALQGNTAELAELGKAFNQPQPQFQPAKFQPIQMAKPAGIQALLAAAALRNRDLT